MRVYLDGISIGKIEACNIIPSSVEKIEFLFGTQASIAIGVPNRAVLIAIYRKKGADQWGSSANVGIVRTKVKGYYRAREFYSPDYDKPQEGFTGLDIRNTLYWQPIVTTGEDGSATITFFNGDKTTGYNVNVQGIGLLGGIGRGNAAFEVVEEVIQP